MNNLDQKEKMCQFLIANLKSISFYYLANEEYDALFAGLNMYSYLDNKEIFNKYFNKSGKEYVENISEYYYNHWLPNKIFFQERAFRQLLQATLKLIRDYEILSELGYQEMIKNIMIIVIHIYQEFGDEKFEKYVGRLEYGGQESVSC